ncbi:hypothetical protein FACS18949_06550 [Clostridia bacterium]|nr:hypothetical protein FACS189425_07030 [Clostridia bacterium]GHV33218.1 hypothetical protein FACS18949_06550 [Clostridia bacterium]
MEIGTYTPENFFAGDYPIAKETAAVKAGATVARHAPVKLAADGTVSPVTLAVATEVDEDNSVYDVDYTHSLPPPLREDTKMLAFAQVMANRFRENAELAKLANIYARIDELPEKLLDILAYDLHVDWYDYSYPVEAKRQLIKDSIKVHKRLGTVYALKTALGSLYPQSDIEEWFDYGGQPGHFRVTLDVTNALVTASYSQIIRTVAYFKRLLSRLGGNSAWKSGAGAEAAKRRKAANNAEEGKINEQE